ncbi:hypothetical protein CEXT_384711 [Caerostris extrusa]|uniref:Uncharacterized protein n=1 Tax=Caerostris extrusa TaxID=172846 RepID=A0AAV4RXD8_CAEEX|nr:hypothetical protein CEXT_384711 [Caerostris extrusa]
MFLNNKTLNGYHDEIFVDSIGPIKSRLRKLLFIALLRAPLRTLALYKALTHSSADLANPDLSAIHSPQMKNHFWKAGKCCPEITLSPNRWDGEHYFHAPLPTLGEMGNGDGVPEIKILDNNFCGMRKDDSRKEEGIREFFVFRFYSIRSKRVTSNFVDDNTFLCFYNAYKRRPSKVA